MSFIDNIKERAKKDKKTIVLPETMDRRIMEATEKILKDDIANIILIGKEEEIEEKGKGFDISKATVINPFTSPLTDELIEKLVEIRKNKGLTYEDAKKLLIISDKWDEIRQYLIQEIDRGVTVLDGHGGYSQEKKNVLMCIISKKQSNLK